jgi:hypothetical protein
MRNFDNWDRYQDNERNPLHGCVQFNVKDGNTVAPIYDTDGTELANPQVTDNYGRTKHQVFIDTDVVAYFYKYVGEGVWSGQEDIDTSDVTKWSLQYTSENMLDILKKIKTDVPIGIATMEELRATNIDDIPEFEDKKVITLLGYFKSGDKEPINYIWDPNSTTQDNGGSVIKSDDNITGRWIMVQPTEHCDSRHFGAFPSNSYNMDDQTYQISWLFYYCWNAGIRPFFNGSYDYRWFKYTNMIATADDIDVSPETRFYDLGSNRIYGQWHGDPAFTQGNTAVYQCADIKTSWNASSYNGYKNVVIDQDTPQKTWQDANVEILINPCIGYSFTHCVLSENGNIGSDNTNNINPSFYNCKLNERMFILNGVNRVSLAGLCTDCQIDMDDFRNSMWLYKQIRLTSDSNAFFDFRDMPNVGQPISDYIGNKITSDTIYISNLKNMVNGSLSVLNRLGGRVQYYYLDNCTGFFEVPAGLTVYISNSNVKLDLNNNTVLGLTNSTVTLDSHVPTTILHMSLLNSTINGHSTSTVYNVADLACRNSVISAKFDVTSSAQYYSCVITQDQKCATAEVTNCKVASEIMLYGVSGADTSFDVHDAQGNVTTTLHTTRYVKGLFKDNYVTGYLTLGAPSGNTHAVTNWLAQNLYIENNTGYAANPIRINRGTSTLYEQYNNYSYRNNTGTFPGHHSLTLNMNSGYYTVQSSSGRNLYCFTGKIDNWVEPHTGETGHTDVNVYMTQFTMFSVGVYNVRFKAKTTLGGTAIAPFSSPPNKDFHPTLGTTTVLDTVERSYQEYQADAQVYTPWAKDLSWISGMTWRITKWYGFIDTYDTVPQSAVLMASGPMDIDFEIMSAWPNIT